MCCHRWVPPVLSGEVRGLGAGGGVQIGSGSLRVDRPDAISAAALRCSPQSALRAPMRGGQSALVPSNKSERHPDDAWDASGWKVRAPGY
ncbi:unnamed protein product [Lampetra fluviatilis]